MAAFSNRRRRTFESEALPHLDALYRLALRLSGDPALSEDLVQETMMRAYRSWERYRPGTNVRAWLFTILRNALISDYRQRKRYVHSIDLAAVEERTPFRGVEGRDPTSRFFDRIVGEEVVRAIDALPDEYKEALVLSDIEGLAYHEIADVVGVPIGTVKSRLHRARLTLKRKLYDYAVEMGYIRARPAVAAGASSG